MLENLPGIIIVTGHYGSGKTNLSINLARILNAQGRTVALADLDIVNPYFRSSDFVQEAADWGIELIASEYNRSSLDLPALSPSLDAAIANTDANRTLIIDVGGDDAGATALGRYGQRLKTRGYAMLCVVNRYRYLTQTAEDSLQMIRDIEGASRLPVTHIVGNSHLCGETTAADIRAAIPYAQEVSALSGLPLLFTTAQGDLAGELSDLSDILPIDVYVGAQWK